MRKKEGQFVKCLICDKEFWVKPFILKKGIGKFCSNKCYGKHRSLYFISKNNPTYRGTEIKCLVCGKNIHVIPFEKDTKKYCSRKCSDIGSKGRHNSSKTEFKKGHLTWIKNKTHSEETKKKLSIINKGRIGYWRNKQRPEEQKRKISKTLLGRKLSEETKRKLCLAHSGSKNSNWKGGLTKNPERIRLRKKTYHSRRRTWEQNGGKLTTLKLQMIYEDNIKLYGTLTCYLCLKPIEFGKDSIDHIIPLSRGGTNEYNNLGIACKKCNCKKHTRTEEEYRRYLWDLVLDTKKVLQQQKIHSQHYLIV